MTPDQLATLKAHAEAARKMLATHGKDCFIQGCCLLDGDIQGVAVAAPDLIAEIERLRGALASLDFSCSAECRDYQYHCNPCSCGAEANAEKRDRALRGEA